jgi:hypothetical protein
MSHVATINMEVKDLESLKAAAKQLGLEFVLNQKTYRWWGRSVGDYPLPYGFTAADLGHCDHAIRIPGNDRAYEIGVVKRKDGKPGYQLLWDFYQGGYGLQEKVGENAKLLTREYTTQVAIKPAIRQGYRIQRQVKENGEVIITAVK